MTEDVSEQVITKMIQDLSEDTNKKLNELNKMTQNINDQCSKATAKIIMEKSWKLFF